MSAALPVSPLPRYLENRYRAWHGGSFEENKAWYARLASAGQHPRAMVVSCCDSRVDSLAMFGAEPGDLFVVRNVAALIPPYNPDHQHHGTSAAVEFAVTGLQIAHIIVVGHSGCGGVHACHDMCAGLAPQLEEKSSFVGRWMDILRPGYDRVATRAEDIPTRKSLLEKEAVRVSLTNLHGFPFVAKAIADGMLTLHGAWIDIGTGKLEVLDREDRFTGV